MKPSLPAHLACPIDKHPLQAQVRERAGEEILEGSLRCDQGHVYSITKGIPRFVWAGQFSSDVDKTSDFFSRKWTQLSDFGFEPASRDFYVRWNLERYGFKDRDGLRSFLADKKKILDAGTGLGRDALLYAEHAAGEVFALDIGESIDLAYRRLGHLPNVHLVQASLTSMPFREGFFDYLACDQVLHHTDNTENSFRYLTRHLAPGGQLGVYVYKKKGPIREFCDDFLRERFTKSSPQECYEFSKAMTTLGKALTEQNIRVTIPEDIPALGIKAGEQDLQRFLYWNIFKCYWNDTMDFETNVMTNYDWYSPQHAYRHSPQEVQAWCAAEGLQIAHFDVVESGITVRAQKPALVSPVIARRGAAKQSGKTAGIASALRPSQ